MPPEVAALAGAPLFKAEYKATEAARWFSGVPLLSRRLSSERDVRFSNEFSVLRTQRGPMISYGGSTYEEAVGEARRVALKWSHPSYGGQIHASVSVAVLQPEPDKYFLALIGSGDPKTSEGELAYRRDRFDGNIYGRTGKGVEVTPTSEWSRPVDRKKRPAADEGGPDGNRFVSKTVSGVTVSDITSGTDMLKAIVDIKNVIKVG